MSYSVIRLSHVIGRQGPTVGMLRASMIVSLLSRSFFIQCFAGAVVESRASTPQAAAVPLDKSAGTDSYCLVILCTLPFQSSTAFLFPRIVAQNLTIHTHAHTHKVPNICVDSSYAGSFTPVAATSSYPHVAGLQTENRSSVHACIHQSVPFSFLMAR